MLSLVFGIVLLLIRLNYRIEKVCFYVGFVAWTLEKLNLTAVAATLNTIKDTYSRKVGALRSAVTIAGLVRDLIESLMSG